MEGLYPVGTDHSIMGRMRCEAGVHDGDTGQVEFSYLLTVTELVVELMESPSLLVWVHPQPLGHARGV